MAEPREQGAGPDTEASPLTDREAELVAGAVYLFAGQLTTGNRLVLGASHDAAPAAEEAKQFCLRYGIGTGLDAGAELDAKAGMDRLREHRDRLLSSPEPPMGFSGEGGPLFLHDDTPGGEWRRTTLFLFDLLDDIDTAADMAKGDHAAYRAMVHEIQRRRFMVGTPAGSTVYFHPAPEGDSRATGRGYNGKPADEGRPEPVDAAEATADPGPEHSYTSRLWSAVHEAGHPDNLVTVRAGDVQTLLCRTDGDIAVEEAEAKAAQGDASVSFSVSLEELAREKLNARSASLRTAEVVPGDRVLYMSHGEVHAAVVVGVPRQIDGVEGAPFVDLALPFLVSEEGVLVENVPYDPGGALAGFWCWPQQREAYESILKEKESRGRIPEELRTVASEHVRASFAREFGEGEDSESERLVRVIEDALAQVLSRVAETGGLVNMERRQQAPGGPRHGRGPGSSLAGRGGLSRR